jgi:hypothetical protein
MKKKITIDNISKESPFLVPDNYFDKMRESILQKIDIEKEVTIENKPFIVWKKWALATAAVFTIFIGIYFTQIYQNSKAQESEFAQISNAQMVQFLEYENIDIADISGQFKKNDLETLGEEYLENTPIEIDNKTLNQIENKYF